LEEGIAQAKRHVGAGAPRKRSGKGRGTEAVVPRGEKNIMKVGKEEVVMKEVDKDTFDTEVTGSELPVVVDFWGPQCVPCLALMPSVEAMAARYAGQIRVAKVEAPKNRRLCLSLKVLALPTFLFYKDGKEVERISGNGVSIQMIEDSIKKLL
jgi:thioredoxin 1